uniref:G_PROTEIN_RECEP_F1_2 domain-containing protein n=1 Tax=Globodera pallida TaxID=36090 RepID=A0A183BJD2_GLOPA
MAAADTLSLLALMLALGSHHLANRESSTILVASVCKLDTFLIHASSAFGIWCWLILSGLRYLAIHHPYAHLRLHREPMLILVCAAIGCCLLESWILFDVTYLEEARTCGETLPEELGKILQLVEILWTYFVPLSLIIVLDLKLLCCHSTRLLKRFLAHSATLDSAWDVASGVGVPSPANSAALSRPPLRDFVLTPTRVRRVQQLRILKRCLCISIIDLVMNLPNYLVRLYLSLASNETLELVSQNSTFLWFQDFSQLLYFAQFSMNALYLVAINYVLPDRKSRKKETVKAAMAAIHAQQQIATIPRNYKRC